MKSLGRRGFLKAMAAAPVAGRAIAEDLIHQGARNLVYGTVAGSGLGGGPPMAETARARRFLDFGAWYGKHGKYRQEEIAEGLGWDADILGLRLPLPTLQRMQRARNTVKAKELLRERFRRSMSLRGFVEEWL
jgi:hypothetical protein